MSWKSQLADSLVSVDALCERFGVAAEPLRAAAARYPLRITPHYLSLIETPGDPIWRQCVPDALELVEDGLPQDSLNEAAFTPTPALVHRYPDRALLMVSGQCAGYCRFCTRKSRVGTADLAFSDHQLAEGIAYIADTPQIRDVILTGGDPLLLDDDTLEELLWRCT
ncbi:MAG: lysine 2,3-aminomutase, partial [Desulfuromonadales bacterium]|nr:lysine 2,3-aminomutase [Desulfuromonadales bacterium]